MRTIPLLAFAGSISLLFMFPSGCGGDEAPIRVTTGQNDSGMPPGGSGGTGGSSTTGGQVGTGGSAPVTCDLAALGCEPLSLAGFTLPACCATATSCGVDTSAVAGLSMGAIPPGCFDLSALGTLDAGTGGPGPLPILDGGIVPVPDGDDIHLDPACPGVTVDNAFQPFTAPGCCTPENFCGGSTHELVGSGLTVSLGSYRNAEFSDVLSDAFGGFDLSGFLTVASDPNQSCTYGGAQTSPDAGPTLDAALPPTDSGSSVEDPPDASIPDAALD